MDWYNHWHRHSGIKFVTPRQRHTGAAKAICQQRAEVYEAARPAQSNALERCHPLLESTGRRVDKQANRRARSAHGATLNPGRLNGSQGVTTFVKVTEARYLLVYLRSDYAFILAAQSLLSTGLITSCHAENPQERDSQHGQPKRLGIDFVFHAKFDYFRIRSQP